MSDVVQPRSTGEGHDNDDITVDDTAGGVVLLASNEHRLSALVINTGAAAMRVTTDGSAPTSTRGKLISAGASLSMAFPSSVSEVKAIAVTDDTTANASEVD